MHNQHFYTEKNIHEKKLYLETLESLAIINAYDIRAVIKLLLLFFCSSFNLIVSFQNNLNKNNSILFNVFSVSYASFSIIFFYIVL